MDVLRLPQWTRSGTLEQDRGSRGETGGTPVTYLDNGDTRRRRLVSLGVPRSWDTSPGNRAPVRAPGRGVERGRGQTPTPT